MRLTPLVLAGLLLACPIGRAMADDYDWRLALPDGFAPVPRCALDDAGFTAYVGTRKTLTIPAKSARAGDALCGIGNGAVWDYLDNPTQSSPIQVLKAQFASPVPAAQAADRLAKQKDALKTVTKDYQDFDAEVAQIGAIANAIARSSAAVNSPGSSNRARLAIINGIIKKEGQPVEEEKAGAPAFSAVLHAAQGGDVYVRLETELSKLAALPLVDRVLSKLDAQAGVKLAADALDLDDAGTKDFNRAHMALLFVSDADCALAHPKAALCYIDKAAGKRVKDGFAAARKTLNQFNELARTTSDNPACTAHMDHTSADSACPHDGTVAKLVGKLQAAIAAESAPVSTAPVVTPPTAAVVDDLTKTIRARTMAQLGLDKVFDNASGQPTSAATPEQKAAIAAIMAGKVQQMTGGVMQFQYTLPKAQTPTFANIPMSGTTMLPDVDAVAKDVKDALIKDQPILATLIAVSASVAGPLSAMPGGPQVASLLGPGTVLGGSSGCGSSGGQTLSEYKDKLSDARAATAADNSRHRQEAYETHRKAFEAAAKRRDDAIKTAQDEAADPNNPLPADQKRSIADGKIANANRQYNDDINAADLALQSSLQTYLTDSQQQRRNADQESADNTGAEQLYKDQVARRVEDYRANPSAAADTLKDYASSGARKYLIKPEFKGKIMENYFIAQWPASKAEPYPSNLNRCANKIRNGNPKDLEQCVGDIFSEYIDARTASGGPVSTAAPAPTSDEAAAARRVTEGVEGSGSKKK